MTDRVFNVLFLCTGNSARSVIGEVLVTRLGNGRFRGFSAGSHPKGVVNPRTLELLRQQGFETSALRSKSWDEFAQPGAPVMDFVFTVCDDAADEVCPVWPGQPITAHWGVPDPAAATGSDAQIALAFVAAYRALSSRIAIFTSLPTEKLDRATLQRRVREIGTSTKPPAGT